MLPTREILGTGVVTSAIGFGCAGLYRVPHRGNRLSVLEAAFDVGIRHFDAAPMYGLGLAEAELGAFIKRHRRDVTITTKFGIEPTLLTRTLAPLQGPTRVVLAKCPGMNEGLKRSGKNADSGVVGRLLYHSPGYHRRAAQRSLERSLRALGTDYIDIFLLHDPLGGVLTDPSELVAFLDGQCKDGRIRCWGVTGHPTQLTKVLADLGWPAVVQYRDDVFDDKYAETMDAARITYGALARALPVIRRFVARSPEDSALWSQRLDVDLGADSVLPCMLLSAALGRNTAGPVLFTTTRPERAAVAAVAATTRQPSAIEAGVFNEFISAVRAGEPPKLAGRS
jgi:D-threo-aldose 1-dehydrogenase